MPACCPETAPGPFPITMAPSRLLLLPGVELPVWKVSVSSGAGNRVQRLQLASKK
jgi:hypothetical protein